MLVGLAALARAADPAEPFISQYGMFNSAAPKLGDSMWGEPTALCEEYGCVTLPAYAGGNAPQWVEDNTGWTDSITHGVGTAAPVNSRDPFYDRDSTGWDVPLHPICALEAVEAPSPPPPSPTGGVGFR